MGIVEEAFSRLFPGTDFLFSANISYSGKFKPYNANAKRAGTRLVFSLSREWKKVSDEIVIGLIQELLLKMLRKKAIATTNMELYNSFIKNLHLTAARTEDDEQLGEAFERVNARYFFSSVEKPNLKWGQGSRRKLASYDYHTDTITVSSLFKTAAEEIIDYLVYHELLHKKLKFHSSRGSGRSIHHGKRFRQMEKGFENSQQIEKQIERFVRSSGIKKLFGW